jgi:TctA family transporter
VRPARAIATAAAVSALLGLAIQVLPGIDQVNGEIIALLLPGHLALAWAMARIPTRAV